jgi:hypothetical protein
MSDPILNYRFVIFLPNFIISFTTATKADGTTVTYPNEAIIVKDHMDAAQEYKYNVLGYSKLAENDSGINSFYMYLPRNGYFYIHIDMPVADYSNMTLSINPTDSITIDMMDRMASTFTEELFDKAEIGDYAKTITINQTGKFTIDFSTVDNINGGAGYSRMISFINCR